MSTVLKFLKARHGDAFIIECEKDGKAFVMVVDSGPKLCIKDIVPVIEQLPQIDLLVLTHYDEELCNELLDDIDYHFNKVKCRKIEMMMPQLMKMVDTYG